MYDLTMESMRLCMKTIESVDDLKLRIINNRSKVDFVISDDPAVFANRYATQRLNKAGFGVHSAGMIMMMPLTPRYAVICYDNQVLYGA